MSNKNNIGLLGFGTVGQGFYSYFKKNSEEKNITEVVIKNQSKQRNFTDLKFTTDTLNIFNNATDTVVELISDDLEAYNIIKEALTCGKKVVTANKKAIVYHLEEFVKLEEQYGGRLLYEGAVCGSIPILRIINDFYRFDNISEIRGIFNGTSNYILSQLFSKGISYSEALQQAKKNGFAEENPVSDVGGFDALYKLLILATHVYGKFVLPENALNIGIENISVSNISFARKYNLKIKLIASVKNIEDRIYISVLPTFVPQHCELYWVDNEFNGVKIISENLGFQFYKGKGAGKFPIGHTVYTDYKTPNNYKYAYSSLQGKINYTYTTQNQHLIYSNKIALLESAVSNLQILEGNTGFGLITTEKLIKLKPYLLKHNISIIAVSEQIKKKIIDAEVKHYGYAFA